MCILLSIITPSYNREGCLHKVFSSLASQTLQSFEWIVVDDGSTDETKQAISFFQEKKLFPIHYIYKENGGKHTAVNLGIKHAEGELTLILDSDDELPQNAVETIVRRWEEMQQSLSSDSMQTMGGLAFCMAHRDGQSITKMLHSQYILPIDACEIDLRYKYGIQGDICEVFRTDVLREFPFPEISGEKFCPEQLVWFRIAQRYKIRMYGDVLYMRDYLDGGLTDNIVRIRMNSPVATCMTYAEMLNYHIPIYQKAKAAINFFRFRDSMKHNHAVVSHVRWCWWVLRPIGRLMYIKDLKVISKL